MIVQQRTEAIVEFIESVVNFFIFEIYSFIHDFIL